MRKFLVSGAMGAVLFAVPATAGAAPSDNGACRQFVHDATVAASTEGTRGDFVSDVFYGNEPNIVGPFAPGGPSEQEPGTKGGRVVPSQSPGPKVTTPGGVVAGPTFGDFQQGVKAFCNP